MKNAQKPAWVYVLTGLIIGLFVAGLVYLSSRTPSKSAKPSAKQEAQQIGSKVGKAVSAKIEGLQAKVPAVVNKANLDAALDFYEELPKTKVVVGKDLDPKIAQRKQAAAAAKAAKAAKVEQAKAVEAAAPAKAKSKAPQVWLQISSFNDFAHADAQRAELILAGWNVKVQQAVLANNKQVYRVLVGTIDADKVDAALAKLKQHGINNKPLVVRAD